MPSGPDRVKGGKGTKYQISSSSSNYVIRLSCCYCYYWLDQFSVFHQICLLFFPMILINSSVTKFLLIYFGIQFLPTNIKSLDIIMMFCNISVLIPWI